MRDAKLTVSQLPLQRPEIKGNIQRVNSVTALCSGGAITPSMAKKKMFPHVLAATWWPSEEIHMYDGDHRDFYAKKRNLQINNTTFGLMTQLSD